MSCADCLCVCAPCYCHLHPSIRVLQDNYERVLTVYCCWQAALMLEHDSLQPPEFAEAVGLQMQQLQHLQTAVMTVLAWGDFDSYLHASQAVLAAGGV